MLVAFLLQGLCYVIPDRVPLELLTRRLAHGYWPRLNVLKDRFEEMALKVRSDPRSVEIDRSILKDLVQEVLDDMYPIEKAEVEEGGSYAEDTSIDGVSDYDLWLYTPDMSQKDRVRLRDELKNAFEFAGLSVIKRQNKDGIGRKAIKLSVANDGYALNLDIVPLNMIKDVGFHEHIFRRFTGCKSRRDAQETASEHVLKHRESRLAICLMKALCTWEENLETKSIPGFLLNHVARRMLKPDSSASALFQEMAQSLMAFSYLRDLQGRPQTLEDRDETMKDFNSETWHQQLTAPLPFLYHDDLKCLGDSYGVEVKAETL